MLILNMASYLQSEHVQDTFTMMLPTLAKIFILFLVIQLLYCAFFADIKIIDELRGLNEEKLTYDSLFLTYLLDFVWPGNSTVEM